jgi:hypothetical protein
LDANIVGELTRRYFRRADFFDAPDHRDVLFQIADR